MIKQSKVPLKGSAFNINGGSESGFDICMSDRDRSIMQCRHIANNVMSDY